MNEQTTNGVKVVYPDYLLPIFNRCLFTLTGCTQDIRTEITCDGVTYTDYRTPYNGKVELDIAGYLRAFFPTFKDDKVRAKSVSVKMYNGSTSVFDKAFLAIFTVSSPSAPLGKPLICKYYPNIPVIQKYTLVANEGDTAGYAEGAWAVYNQMAEQTYVGSFNATTANNYRAYLGVGYKHTNPTHKYLAAIKLNAKNGSSDISLDASASVGVGKGSFNQNIGIFKTNTNAYVFFTPKYAEYNYFSVYTRGAETAGDSFSLEVYIYDLTRMFDAGNEPTNITDFINRKPNVSGSVYNGGELTYNDGGTLLPSWVGLKDYEVASNQKDIVVVHREGEVALHRFIKSEETCGVFLRWIDSQGFIRFFLFTEGEVKTAVKDSSDTITHDYQGLQPVGGVFADTMKLPQGVTTTVTQVLCAVLSTEEDRELLDTLHYAPLVWMVKPNGEEIPVTIKRGTRSTAKGLQDYEIEVNVASTEQNL